MTKSTGLDDTLAQTGADGSPAKTGGAELSRRELLRQGGALGLALPLMGGLTSAAGLAVATTPARAAAPGQLVLGVTQEAVNFNPLLYVNTGVETSVEFIVF